jgi:hypothetical protein
MPDLVYRGDPQTCTAIPVPPAGADCHISTNGSAANWSSITSENFLAGPKPGQEQVLIKVGNKTAKVAEGQRLEEVQKRNWLHVYDTATENADFEFDKHRNTTVSKNDTLRVIENQNVTVVKDQTVRVEQNQNVTVNETRKIIAKEISELGDRKITIQTNGEIIIQGPGGSITINSKGVTIQGVLVKIN